MANEQRAGKWLQWAQVDVFADRRYEGNMLAIFHDATGLTDAHMQAIARETNLSETTFVFPRPPEVEAAEGVRVRIFTTAEELPFAGHPTLGTASWLRLHRPEFASASSVTLALNVGPVTVSFPEGAPADLDGSLLAEMIQPRPTFLTQVAASECAMALGIASGGMHASLPPQVVSTGLPVVVVPLASLDALAAIRPDQRLLDDLCVTHGAKFAYCIAQQDDTTWHARLPLYGGEDPATGSAAGCAVSYLVARGALQPEQALTLRQGRFIHRPSRILAMAGLDTAGVNCVRVRGCTMLVAEGRFLQP